MFFIGLFGINSDAKASGSIRVGRCPVCGGERPLSVTRTWQNFSAFFVPLVRFHNRYYATCPGCASLFEIPEDLGKRAGRERVCQADASQLTLLRRGGERRCPSCGGRIDEADSFCRNCGFRL